MKTLQTLAALATVMLPSIAAAQTESLGDAYIGRQIARAAIIDYRMQADPGPADARAGAMLLELASEFRPDDPIVLRYLVEAYRAAGDEQSLIDATKRLYDLDPGDEVAQLRLISWSISRRQTVGERLAAYAEWLDGRGAEFLKDRPAVASRLALDAALLYRETGDEDAFLGRLAQATRLDSSHKEAAALSAAVFAQRSDDPVGQLEMAVNLLLTDPVDPNLHLAIAERLAAFGVFDQSRRFYNNANRLYELSGANAETPAMIAALTSLDWYAAGPATILESYETQLRTRRAAAERRIEQLEELGQPTRDEVQPEDIRLDRDRERFRLHAAVALGDQVAAERSVADLDASIEPLLEQLEEMRVATDAADQERLNAIGVEDIALRVSSVVARFVGNVDIRTANARLDAIASNVSGGLGRQVDFLYAVSRYRTSNNPAEAAAELEPYAQQTALGAYFYALALSDLGRTDEAIEQFQRTADAAPVDALGVLASSKAEQLRGSPAAPAVNAEALRAVAQAVPEWVDRVTTGPRNYMRLGTRVSDPIGTSTDEMVLSIEVRNLLPKPIAVGGNRPVGTRMAISPRFDVASHVLRGRIDPEIVETHRKLRLEPGQAASIEVWPDAGMMGLFAESKAAHRVRARFSVLQSFIINNGSYQRGPLSLNAESQLVTRTPLRTTLLSADEMLRYIQVADEDTLLAVLPAVRAALADVDFPSGQVTGPQAEALAGALAERYPRLSRTLRAAVIAIIPTRSVSREMLALDRVLVADDDPSLQRLALLTRATSAEIPELVAATGSDDPDHAWFAQHVVQRLSADNRNGFAFMQPLPSHLPEPPADDTDR